MDHCYMTSNRRTQRLTGRERGRGGLLPTGHEDNYLQLQQLTFTYNTKKKKNDVKHWTKKYRRKQLHRFSTDTKYTKNLVDVV